jgi:hypothetical protein
MTQKGSDGAYLLKLETYNRGIEKASDTLSYLCAFVEQPFDELGAFDIGPIGAAIAAVSEQLRFMTTELVDNDLIISGEDKVEYVVMERSQVIEVARLAEIVEEKTALLRDLCHIGLEIN